MPIITRKKRQNQVLPESVYGRTDPIWIPSGSKSSMSQSEIDKKRLREKLLQARGLSDESDRRPNSPQPEVDKPVKYVSYRITKAARLVPEQPSTTQL